MFGQYLLINVRLARFSKLLFNSYKTADSSELKRDTALMVDVTLAVLAVMLSVITV